MKKLSYFFLMCMIACFSSLHAQTYHEGDVAILEGFRDNNFTVDNTLGWTDEDPGNWLGVKWNNSEPRRVILLSLGEPSNGSNIQNDSWSVSHEFKTKNGNIFTDTNLQTDMSGDLDFSGLSELEGLDLRRQALITSINMSGLQNFKYLYFSRGNAMTELDLSGLTSLEDVHIPKTDITSLDISSCPNLIKVKASWEGTIKSVNITGSNAIRHLNIKHQDLRSIDVSNLTMLNKLAVNNNLNLTEVTGTENLLNLYAYSGSFTSRTSNPDVANFDLTKIYKYSVGRGQLSDLTNKAAILDLDNMQTVNIGDNYLTLTDAVQVDNMTGTVSKLNNATSKSYGPEQTRYGGGSMIVPVSLDYSSEALIDVNGSDVATTFTLFKSGTGEISNNTTGLFDITGDANAGTYYLTMVNSGVTLTTNNIEVLVGGSSIISPSITQDFGEVYLDESVANTLTVSNTGAASLEITDITVPTGFTISGTTAIIAAGASTDFTVTFSPTEAIDYSGNIVITSDADGGNGTVALTASGKEKVSILSKTLTENFGEIVVGESKTQTMTLENTGVLSLAVTNIKMPANFTIDATTATLAAGASQDFMVTFTPTASSNLIQSYSGIIEVVCDANQGSKFHSVTGKGLSFSFMNAFVSGGFGDVEIGSSDTQTLTLKNSSGVDVTVSDIVVPEGFTIDGTTATLAAGTSKSFVLTFSPTEIKAYDGDIMITSNASAGDNTVSLTGSGIAVTVLDVEDLNPLVQLHPNPTTDGIIYINGNNKDMSLSVHTLTGELVKKIELSAQSNQIDVSNISKGIYFLTSVDGNINHKFIKK